VSDDPWAGTEYADTELARAASDPWRPLVADEAEAWLKGEAK
jgi:hypothetical protein